MKNLLLLIFIFMGCDSMIQPTQPDPKPKVELIYLRCLPSGTISCKIDTTQCPDYRQWHFNSGRKYDDADSAVCSQHLVTGVNSLTSPDTHYGVAVKLYLPDLSQKRVLLFGLTLDKAAPADTEMFMLLKDSL